MFRASRHYSRLSGRFQSEHRVQSIRAQCIIWPKYMRPETLPSNNSFPPFIVKKKPQNNPNKHAQFSKFHINLCNSNNNNTIMWGGKKSLNSSCCNIQKMKTKTKISLFAHFLSQVETQWSWGGSLIKQHFLLWIMFIWIQILFLHKEKMNIKTAISDFLLTMSPTIFPHCVTKFQTSSCNRALVMTLALLNFTFRFIHQQPCLYWMKLNSSPNLTNP